MVFPVALVTVQVLSCMENDFQVFECIRHQNKREARIALAQVVSRRGGGGAGRTKKWTRDCWKVNSDLAMRSALQAAFRTTEHNFFQYANRQLGPSIFLLVVLFAIFRLQA